MANVHTVFTYHQCNGHIYIVESISETTVDSESGHVILGVQVKLHVTVECVACKDYIFDHYRLLSKAATKLQL